LVSRQDQGWKPATYEPSGLCHRARTVLESVTVKFLIPDIDAFIGLSGDTNPLHSDDAFAKAAGFEQRVVPGMLAVLGALPQYTDHVLSSLRARFQHPLYPNIEYPLGLRLGGGPGDNCFWIGSN